jgi:peptidoglycan/LPS O-acetylase OafA/YrhL
LAGQIEAHWSALPLGWAPWVDWALRIFIGSQGKYLEVFGIGMLCAVAYLVMVERRPSSTLSTPYGWRMWAGVALMVAAVAIYLAQGPTVFLRRNEFLAQWYLRLPPYDVVIMLGPLLLGLGYGALVLGVLIGPAWSRAIFSWRSLRFIGLISYSLYLWHETIITTVYSWLPLPHSPQPLNGLAAIAIAAFVAVPFAYLSYQFIERPFLKLR